MSWSSPSIGRRAHEAALIYILALGSAVLYGAGDFVGGLVSRRVNTISVVAVSQVSGLLGLLVTMPLLPPASPTAADLVWGVAAGLAGSVGVALLYQALAIGTMGVVAPVTAVCAVAIPVIVSALQGHRLPPAAAAGIGLALVAIVLVAQERRPAGAPDVSTRAPARSTESLVLAFASGVAIGIFFLALARTGQAAGLWPLVASRSLSAGLFTVLAWTTGRPLRLPRRAAVACVLCGVLDVAANALYLLATREGTLPIVVTLASMYPASTVVLARVVLGEHLSPAQSAGLLCALVAVALIVLSGAA